MPERPISRAEKYKIQINWIGLQPGVKIRRQFGPHEEEIVYSVNGEALSITFVNQPNTDEMGYYRVDDPDSFMLDCSDKHAQSMEAAGVLFFSEESTKNSRD